MHKKIALTTFWAAVAGIGSWFVAHLAVILTLVPAHLQPLLTAIGGAVAASVTLHQEKP